MIPFLDLKAINASNREELIEACTRVIDSGWYIGGNELSRFESAFADYCGIQHCIGVARRRGRSSSRNYHRQEPEQR